MDEVHQHPLSKLWRVISLAFPCLFAIVLLELISIEILLHGPIAGDSWMFILWNGLQMIPALAFGYLSDRTNRKNILICSQLIGLAGGIVLYIFGATPWVLIFIAMTFNPVHVARAALLDVFPRFSTLKLVAITFLALNLPWMFFKEFSAINYNFLVLMTLVLLGINSLFTYWFFQDRQEFIHPKVHIKKSIDLRTDKRILYTLFAFMCSETTFYLIWIYIEYSEGIAIWLDITTFATLIGILIAMLYNRLPHMSIITLFYSIGMGLMLVAAYVRFCLYFPIRSVC